MNFVAYIDIYSLCAYDVYNKNMYKNCPATILQRGISWSDKFLDDLVYGDV